MSLTVFEIFRGKEVEIIFKILIVLNLIGIGMRIRRKKKGEEQKESVQSVGKERGRLMRIIGGIIEELRWTLERITKSERYYPEWYVRIKKRIEGGEIWGMTMMGLLIMRRV